MLADSLPWVSLPPFLIGPEIRPRPLVMTGLALRTIIPAHAREEEKITSFRLLKFSARRRRNEGRPQSAFAKPLNLKLTWLVDLQNLPFRSDSLLNLRFRLQT